MQTTANLGLKKPDGTDVVNITDLNDNANIIDSEITKIKSGVTVVATATNAEELGGQLPSYYTPAARSISTSGGLTGGGNLTTNRTISIADSGVTDTKIGNRTISDTSAPTGDSGLVATLFGWIANMIKAITGKTNWRTAPATTLEAAKGHMDAAAPHSGHETPSGAQSKADAAAAAGVAAAGTVQTNLGTHAATSATETAKGHVELATAAETTTGTDSTRAVHPAGLKIELDKKAAITRTVTAGNGLTGGGDLSADRTITLGTPGTLTAATINSATATSHTHAITTASVATVSTIMSRDSAGRAKVAAPSAADDIARKDTVDAVQANLDALTLGNIAGTVSDTQHGSRSGGSLHSVATTSTAGFMAAADKSKLNGIATGAEVNQNAFTTIKIGTTNVVADSKTDTLELVAGTGITLTPDTTNDKVTITVDDTQVALQSEFATHLVDYVKQVPYAVATGTANTYAVTLSPAPTAYVDGMAVAVKINVASTGASTLNVNGLGAKAIKDSLGNSITSGGLKANIIYSMRYEATSGNFIVQGKGGGGNAGAADLLSGKTATVDTGQITGTMPNKGAYNITPTSSNIIIPTGYHNGSGVVYGVTVPAANVLSGTTIAGVAGTMPNQGQKILTPGPSNITIPQGYHNGSGYVAGVSVPAANVLTGTTIAGVAGTMPNQTGEYVALGRIMWNPGTPNENRLYIKPPRGYYPGSYDGTNWNSIGNIYITEQSFNPSNIRNGIDIFGVTGTCIPGAAISSVQSGTLTSSNTIDKTVTITPVNTSKAILIFSHTASSSIGTPIEGILSTSNIQFLGFGVDVTKLSWFVVEFTSGISVQRGTAFLENNGDLTKTVTISSVNLSKTFLLVYSKGGDGAYNRCVNGYFSSATQITLERYSNISLTRASWQAVSFI